MTERKQSGIPGQNIIWKVAFRTVGRYGKISFLMLFIGFLFVLTTANAYSQLYEELSSSYVISGSVSGQAELEKYNEISSIDVATPVFNVTSTLSNEEASLSASITAVTSDYVDVTFLRGGTFPDESNMPFLVLNRYAAEHFTTQDDTVIAVDVNDTVMMTIQEQEVSAVICGIFEDGLEQPVAYMSYTVASRILPKEETIDLLFRLKRTDDLEEAAKELDKLHVSVTYDRSLPERWKLTKQQIYQTFLSALVLLLCSAIQMAGQNKRERQEALPQLQALCLCGLNQGQVGMLFVLRTLFTELACFAVGIMVAMILQRISWWGMLCCTICLVFHSTFIEIHFCNDRNSWA